VGGKVTINASVDPGMIGGLIVKVGSQMIDTSLRMQLNKMQLAMRGTS
jgi:F-type H+-transporting ATPase subunit delta